MERQKSRKGDWRLPIFDCRLPIEAGRFCCRPPIGFDNLSIGNRQSKIGNSNNGVSDTIMPTATNKQRVLTQIFTGLTKGHKAHGVPAEPESRPVLEQFLYALCREGVTREKADRAFRFLQERFFDWNEVRVSSPRELEEAFGGFPEPEARAQRLIDFLQEVFETTFSFDLDPLHKKGLKQAAKQLARYQAANDYAVAWVIQQSLGGHAIPLDVPTLRVLRRLGLLESEQGGDLESLRASIEHLIPKVRGPLFSELVSALAEEYCYPEKPNCRECPMANSCPTCQAAAAEVAAPTRSARPKPR
jgi:endonuclease III